MMKLFVDATRRIVMARLNGIFGSEELEDLDSTLIQFLSRQPAPDAVRGLFDFEAVEAIALPESKVIARARRPPILGSQRVFVAPSAMGERFAVLFRAHQRLSNNLEPAVVMSLEEALALLGACAAGFTPVAEA